MKPCLVIPFYDHGDTIAEVVESLIDLELPCIIVNDGSHEAARKQLTLLEERFDWVQLVHHERNLGRGAALRTAYRSAAAQGMTHAVQLDADGQHASRDVPRFLEAARSNPDALVLGAPIFDDSAPFHRLHGRKLSQGIVWLLTLSLSVRDPLCGFRCIPLASTLPLLEQVKTGDRMDFDPELIIRLVRAKVPVINVPTAVQYQEEGVSHFRMVEDNLLIARSYVRLAFEGLRYRSRTLDLSAPGSAKDATASEGTEWASVAERGSQFALRFLVGVVNRVGPRPLIVLVAPIALYFALFATEARRASKNYLSHVRRFRAEASGEPGKPDERGEPGFFDVVRHLYSFSTAILDRFALWTTAIEDFDIELHGREHMAPLVERREGAILVGAHLGNFDVLRVIAREANIPVNVLMYSENAERINRAFEELDPNCNLRIINLDSRSLNIGLEIRGCIARGEFVAILADRMRAGSHTSARDRVGHASFLGETAAFPKGPFLLASLLGLPVLLTIALRRGIRSYDIYLEPISEGRVLSAKERPRAIQTQIELYASRLEHYCLKAPLQWFNFYEFWAEGEHGHR